MLEPTDPLPGEEEDEETPTPTARKRKAGGGINVIGVAMLAIGDILEPEKTTVEIVQTNDDPIDDLPFTIDFGDLPPLD